jgi:hypothetical protein
MNDELDWVPLLRGARGVFYVKQLIARYQQPIYLGVTGNKIPCFTLIRKATTDSRFRGNDNQTNNKPIFNFFPFSFFLIPGSCLLFLIHHSTLNTHNYPVSCLTDSSSQYSILNTQYLFKKQGTSYKIPFLWQKFIRS